MITGCDVRVCGWGGGFTRNKLHTGNRRHLINQHMTEKIFTRHPMYILYSLVNKYTSHATITRSGTGYLRNKCSARIHRHLINQHRAATLPFAVEILSFLCLHLELHCQFCFHDESVTCTMRNNQWRY